MLALLAGCVAPSKLSGAGGLHPWTLPGHVRYGAPDEPDSLLEFYAHTAAADEVSNLLFAPLFRYDASGDFLPELATEVPTYANGGISKDGKTIVLHFRKNVEWADGAPLTAHDLAFTYALVMNDRTNVKLREGWDDIAKLDVRSDETAVVHLRRPNADIIGLCFSGDGVSAAAAASAREDLTRRFTTQRLRERSGRKRPLHAREVESRRIARVRRQPSLLARTSEARPLHMEGHPEYRDALRAAAKS